MTKYIWLSDPHFTAENTAPNTVQNHNPRTRLAAAIAFINAHHRDAKCCIISGDMVNRGTSHDYTALANMLATLTIPYAPMMGNHDDRTLLRHHLTLPETCAEDFIQYTLRTDDAVIVALDTHKLGSDAGEYCAQRQNWLNKTLTDNGDLPALVFMHHPPMKLGLPMQDTDRMEHGDRFLTALANHPNVKYLCIGHVHRPVTGVINDIPFATMRSVLYQAPAPQPAWDWSSFAPSAEAPNLGVLTINATGITLQYQQFCPYETGVA